MQPQHATAQNGVKEKWKILVLSNQYYAFFALFTLLLLFNKDILYSLGRLWWQSFTYGHGLLVIPVSIYLIWLKKSELKQYLPQVSAVGLIAFYGVWFCWWLANLSDVEIVQQVSLVFLVATLVWAVFGATVAKLILLPLLYPLVAIPIWNPLEIGMQYMTAFSVAKMAGLLGIPTFLDGYYISIPEGKFAIENVCAGLRYLLATLGISLVAQHMFLHSIKTKLVFLSVCILCSLIVNWIRVFVVVVAGHYSNMQHSLVTDHADFGWWVFAFTLVPIFMFLRYLQKTDTIDTANISAQTGGGGATSRDRKTLTVLIALLLAFAFPVSAYSIKNSGQRIAFDEMTTPNAPQGWSIRSTNLSSDWNPEFSGADREIFVNYGQEQKSVQLFVASYFEQRQGKELIADWNFLYDNKVWSPLGSQKIFVGDLQAKELLIQDRFGRKRLVLFWYYVAEMETSSRLKAKMAQVWGKLTRKAGDSIIAFSTEVNASKLENVRIGLKQFAEKMKHSVYLSLGAKQD